VRIRGQQYHYTGHVCCFGQNTPKTWRQLPRLPAELNILIVRPATVAGAEYLSRRFSKRYTVRRSAIEHWLYFLKINHPDYRDVEICSNRLTKLPENGSILDQQPSINESDSDSSNPIAYPSPTPQAELAPTGNPTPAINHLPIRVGNGIHDSEFDDDVLDTLVPDLMPDLCQLELLSREFNIRKAYGQALKFLLCGRHLSLSDQLIILCGAPFLYCSLLVGPILIHHEDVWLPWLCTPSICLSIRTVDLAATPYFDTMYSIGL
jgi:hypothetical protein